MRNVFTVDLEDYFMVSAFSGIVDFASWGTYVPRIESPTRRILERLAKVGVKATFFVVGWIAERHPSLIRIIREEGHEIGCHSYRHRLVYEMTPEEFRQDTRKAKKAIEDAAGIGIVGYRAPSYSITKRSLWALEILAEEGFRYDSSIFPVLHDRYGIPDFPRFPLRVGGGSGVLLEVPMSTIRLGRRNIPFGGGGYLRLYPYGLTRRCIERINRKEGQPVIVYLHPWEIDTDQPRLKGSALSVFRHYVNIEGHEEKIGRLTTDFRFGPMSDLLAEHDRPGTRYDTDGPGGGS